MKKFRYKKINKIKIFIKNLKTISKPKNKIQLIINKLIKIQTLFNSQKINFNLFQKKLIKQGILLIKLDYNLKIF